MSQTVHHPALKRGYQVAGVLKRVGAASPPPPAAVASYPRGRRAKFTAHERANGRSQFVAATSVLRHLEALAKAGLSRREIERRCGVSRLTILRIVRGELRQIHRRTAGALLAVTPVPLAEQLVGLVVIVGTQRRLRALVAAGWAQSTLARMLATTPSQVRRLLETDRPCSSRMRAAVASLYDSLWAQAPPGSTPAQRRSASRARRYAQERGWAVPMGWDDEEIDSPEGRARPGDSPTRVARPGGRALVPRASARIEDLQWMVETGESLSGACTRLGLAPAALYRQLERSDRLDLWQRLAAREAA